MASKNNDLFLRFPGGLAKALTLSYDDGVTEDIRLVELLDRYGVKGTFNINSGQYAKDGTPSRPDRAWGQRMTREQVTALFSNSNHEVALHTLTHPHLENLPVPQAVYEIIKNREILEEQFDTIVRGMAYPYGTYSDTVVEALRACGVAYARTVASTGKFELPTDWLRWHPTCHHKSPDLPELVDSFLSKTPDNKRAPMLFYLWGHSYEFERDGNWDIMERFCERMGNREEIWYATNMEVYEYVEAFRALVFSANMNLVTNPTAKTVWFAFNGKSYQIEPGETLHLFDA